MDNQKELQSASDHLIRYLDDPMLSDIIESAMRHAYQLGKADGMIEGILSMAKPQVSTRQ